MGKGTINFTFKDGGFIRSVSQFLEEVRKFKEVANSEVYFRGHAELTEGIVPSIGRPHAYLGKSITFDRQSEKRMLSQFRRHAYQHFGRVPTEWETLFLARHHGLPTRLVDWTSNPLVALYFAAFYETENMALPEQTPLSTSDRLNGDGTIWAILRRPEFVELDVFEEHRSPLSTRGIKLIHPFNPTPRITAQSGFFTLHGDPWKDLVACAGRTYRPQELDILRLIRWRVESKHKAAIVIDLERVSINSRTLFPDFEGLARGLWQTEIIRKCFSTAKK